MTTGWYWVRNGIEWNLAYQDNGVWTYRGSVKSLENFDEIGQKFIINTQHHHPKRVFS